MVLRLREITTSFGNEFHNQIAKGKKNAGKN